MPSETRLDFLSPVSRVPGLGPKRAAALAQSGIAAIGELIYWFPRRYIDRSVITPIGDAVKFLDKECTVIGAITKTRIERGRRPRMRVQIADETGSLEALWFAGLPYLRAALHTGMRAVLTGKITRYTGLQMVHPLLESIGKDAAKPEHAFLPRYSITSAMRESHVQQKTLLKSIEWVLNNLTHYPQVLPQAIEKKKAFPPLQQCLREMHLPADPEKIEPFRARLRYEELYQLALTLRWSRRKFVLPGRSMKPGDLLRKVKMALPFALTNEQEEAIAVLHADAAGDRRMHRLLQGDVGSGKTVVAFCACLPALNEGMQVAWLAPTEILARQTHAVLSPWLDSIGIRSGLLTGATAAEEKRRMRAACISGELRFCIGTHALLEPDIKFRRIGQLVIDEQHKFGARQRLALQEKDPASDFLLLSATPIPQTLAKTLYGDLDLVTLRKNAVLRPPVNTHVVPDAKRSDMLNFIRTEIETRHSQVYYIAPRIDAGDEEDDIADVQTAFRELCAAAFASVRTGLLHGQLPDDDKADAMRRFARGELQALVATTVVEVGIDVPEARIIVIENAERFGLSQLHQLRGRVGRKGDAAWCFLLTTAAEESPSMRRLRRFCAEHDGFALADLDLALRGPGEVAGDRQWGWEDMKLADILRDADLFREIQQIVDQILPR